MNSDLFIVYLKKAEGWRVLYLFSNQRFLNHDPLLRDISGQSKMSLEQSNPLEDSFASLDLLSLFIKKLGKELGLRKAYFMDADSFSDLIIETFKVSELVPEIKKKGQLLVLEEEERSPGLWERIFS